MQPIFCGGRGEGQSKGPFQRPFGATRGSILKVGPAFFSEDRGVGLEVSLLTFDSDDPSSNIPEFQSIPRFILLNYLAKVKQNFRIIIFAKLPQSDRKWPKSN